MGERGWWWHEKLVTKWQFCYFSHFSFFTRVSGFTLIFIDFSFLYTKKKLLWKNGGNLHIWRHWKIAFPQAKITFSILIIIIIISSSPSVVVVSCYQSWKNRFDNIFRLVWVFVDVMQFFFFRQYNYTFSLRRKTFHILLYYKNMSIFQALWIKSWK